jgi:uncharacterized protein YodC (DUF2158 family)
MKLEVYNVGSKVKLAEDIDGTIVAIAIHADNNVTYECGWWNGRSYDTRWFHASEIEVTLGERTKIGFV